MIESTKENIHEAPKKGERTIIIFPLVLSYVATALGTLQRWKQYLQPWQQ